MATSLMSKSHASGAPPWALLLARGAARRIVAGGHDRWLTVGEGQLWITTQGDAVHDGADIWLGAGEGLMLRAGVEAVVEARVGASFQLVEAAAAPSVWLGWQRLARWAQRERQALQLGAVVAPCVG